MYPILFVVSILTLSRNTLAYGCHFCEDPLLVKDCRGCYQVAQSSIRALSPSGDWKVVRLPYLWTSVEAHGTRELASPMRTLMAFRQRFMTTPS